jgi:hypothetical protein
LTHCLLHVNWLHRFVSCSFSSASYCRILGQILRIVLINIVSALLFHFIIHMWYAQSDAADAGRFHVSPLTLSLLFCLLFCMKVTTIISYGRACSAITSWWYPAHIPFLLLHLYGIFFVYILNSYFLGEGSYYVKNNCVTMWNWGYLPHYTTWKPHSRSLNVNVFHCYTQTAVKHYLYLYNCDKLYNPHT